jgi:hypothetical protein
MLTSLCMYCSFVVPFILINVLLLCTYSMKQISQCVLPGNKKVIVTAYDTATYTAQRV